MNSTTKNLVETEIRKSLGGGRVDLVLHWRESGAHWRGFQAETYRAAAVACEASEGEGWVVDASIGCGCIGHGLIATAVEVELAEGDAAEQARAEAMLRKVAKSING